MLVAGLFIVGCGEPIGSFKIRGMAQIYILVKCLGTVKIGLEGEKPKRIDQLGNLVQQSR